MSDSVITKQPKPDISTVGEKVILEKQLPFNPKAKKGPTVELFFHELVKEKNFGQKVLQSLGSALLGIFFLITFPVIALPIKIFSNKPVFQKVKVPGQRGIEFHQYRYSGAFLKKSGLAKLPSVINILKGDMDLIGPRPYPAEWCNRWNKHLSDYYKRFAFKPGYIGLTKPISKPNNLDTVANSLKKEFRYILKPSSKKDLRHLLGIV